MTDPDWLKLNRANWDERVAAHRAAPYGNGRWVDGTIRLNAIEEEELGPVEGLRVLHLQCHFGQDSLILGKRGADVTGIDFSLPAIEAARADSKRLGIPARFIHANLYDAPATLAEPASFDLVFITWGTICWLPDIEGWATVIAHFLKPGGRLYFADLHPAAATLDDQTPWPDTTPCWSEPYFMDRPMVIDDPTDYANPGAVLQNSRTVQFIHPIGSIVTALLAVGLRLDALRERPTLTWKQFPCLVQDEAGLWTWPGRAWLPLSVTIEATKTA